MKIIRSTLLVMAALAIASMPAAAQNYPTHPITIIVPYAAGGPSDVVARIVADGMSKVLGQNIVIAWNCSSETARTVAFAMPFLMQAQQITVLTVQKGTVPGPSAAELARNLQRHGLAVEWREVPSGDRGPGDTVLQQAREIGADLLIKGAYTQSRLRQMIFGGVTSHILAESELPVIMAH